MNGVCWRCSAGLFTARTAFQGATTEPRAASATSALLAAWPLATPRSPAATAQRERARSAAWTACPAPGPGSTSHTEGAPTACTAPPPGSCSPGARDAASRSAPPDTSSTTAADVSSLISAAFASLSVCRDVLTCCCVPCVGLLRVLRGVPAADSACLAVLQALPARAGAGPQRAPPPASPAPAGAIRRPAAWPTASPAPRGSPARRREAWSADETSGPLPSAMHHPAVHRTAATMGRWLSWQPGPVPRASAWATARPISRSARRTACKPQTTCCAGGECVRACESSYRFACRMLPAHLNFSQMPTHFH